MIRKYLLITGLIAAMLLIGIAAPTLNGQVAAQDAGADGVAGVEADVGAIFTYQGFLQKDSVAASGTCDFEFKLYDAATGGTQIGGTQTRTGTSVTEGRFTVELDFGPTAFNGQARWLEISVRCPAGSGGYTTLDPRQSLTPAPYANSLRPGAVIEGNVNTPDGILNLTNSGSGSGIHIKNVGADGVLVCATGAETSCTPNNSIHSGVEVANAEHYGLWVTNAGNDGVFIVNAGDDGLQVDAAGDDGLDITASDDGLRVRSAGRAGVRVESAPIGMHVESANNGFQVDSVTNIGLLVGTAPNIGVLVGTAPVGVSVDTAGGTGVHVATSGNTGMLVTTAAGNAFQANSAGLDGLFVQNAARSGVDVQHAGQDGVFICSTGSRTTCDPNDNIHSGIEVANAQHYGLWVTEAGDDGVLIVDAGDDGMQVVRSVDDGIDIGDAGGDGVQVRKAAEAGVRVQSAPIGMHVESAVNGLQVDSVTGVGVRVSTAVDGVYVAGPVSNWAGYFTGDVNVTGTCTGCVLATMAVNTGDSSLQPGDVVALQGSRVDTSTGQPLLMEVGQATGGAPVMGVVYGRGELTEIDKGDGEMATQIAPRAGAAQPGDFVHIVTYGQAQVKASALDGAIALGQKLAVADDGAARSLKTVEVDGVRIAESASTIGTALENSASSKDGLIWVLVNPQ